MLEENAEWELREDIPGIASLQEALLLSAKALKMKLEFDENRLRNMLNDIERQILEFGNNESK